MIVLCAEHTLATVKTRSSTLSHLLDICPSESASPHFAPTDAAQSPNYDGYVARNGNAVAIRGNFESEGNTLVFLTHFSEISAKYFPSIFRAA